MSALPDESDGRLYAAKCVDQYRSVMAVGGSEASLQRVALPTMGLTVALKSAIITIIAVITSITIIITTVTTVMIVTIVIFRGHFGSRRPLLRWRCAALACLLP